MSKDNKLSPAESSTMLNLAQAGLNGTAELEMIPYSVRFKIRCAADMNWLTKGTGYNHVDWQYETETDYKKHREIAGRSWNFIPSILRFNGRAFATAAHSYNHSVRVAAYAYDIVNPALKRTEYDKVTGKPIPSTMGDGYERDKNNNWNPGSHHCLWVGNTYALRGYRTASYDIDGKNSVILAEQYMDIAPMPQPGTVDVNYVIIVTGTNVNIRTVPSTAGNTPAGKVSKPASFRIVKESVGQGASLWGQIGGDGIYKGKWIALDYTVKDAPQPVQSDDKYTVKPGDSLSVIARDLNIPISELIQVNGIEDPNRIFIGQVLKLPK